MRGGPRADDIAIRVAQCLERMRRDFQAKNLELFGEVAFSPPECGWRGSRMAFSDQRAEMPVIHGLRRMKIGDLGPDVLSNTRCRSWPASPEGPPVFIGCRARLRRVVDEIIGK